VNRTALLVIDSRLTVNMLFPEEIAIALHKNNQARFLSHLNTTPGNVDKHVDKCSKLWITLR
jgi:hypothetical protein